MQRFPHLHIYAREAACPSLFRANVILGISESIVSNESVLGESSRPGLRGVRRNASIWGGISGLLGSVDEDSHLDTRQLPRIAIMSLLMSMFDARGMGLQTRATLLSPLEVSMMWVTWVCGGLVGRVSQVQEWSAK